MSDNTNSATAGSDKYYLEDRERWESLGLDWEGWNIHKIGKVGAKALETAKEIIDINWKRVRRHLIRITSYNVCYTKLLRMVAARA